MTAAVKVTEAEFLEQVLDAARIFRWRTAHFRPSRTAHGWRTAVQGDGKGFPDLILTRPPRLVIAELKSAKGQVEHDQKEWINDLASCDGVEMYVWRPADLDEVIAVLR